MKCPNCHAHEVDPKMFGPLRVASCPKVRRDTMLVFMVPGPLVLEPPRG